jgi:hypothetical protein
VIVTLLDSEGTASTTGFLFDFAKNFKMIDSNTYVLKSDVLLEARHEWALDALTQ